jgi:hypothetical protein
VNRNAANRNAANRIVAVARAQSLGRRDAVLWPLVIMSIAFIANLAVFAAIGDADLGAQPITGALSSIYFVCLAFGAVSVNQVFPLALGLSVTRREFFTGLLLFAAVQSVAYALLLVILQAIEDATGGWGIHLRFFGLNLLDRYSPPVQFLMYLAPLLAMTFLGVAIGAVYMRWKQTGIWTGTAALIVVLGGATTLLTYYRAWPPVGRWFVDSSPVALIAGWPALLAVLLAAGSWAALRRTTP